MLGIPKKTGTIIVLMGLFLLSACGAAKTPEAVQDPNAIYTQAAQTVQAQLSATAAMLPTSTYTLEPTATELPTETPEPSTATPAPQTTLPTLSAPGSESTPAAPGIVATATTAAPLFATSTTVAQQAGDHGTWVGNVPADGSTFSKGESFTFVFRIMNTGTTTWTTDYKVVFLGGTGLSSETVVPLNAVTKPGEVGEFYTKVFAPLEAGKYKSNWKLVNPQGAFIYEVYFAFNIK